MMGIKIVIPWISLNAQCFSSIRFFIQTMKTVRDASGKENVLVF